MRLLLIKIFSALSCLCLVVFSQKLYSHNIAQIGLSYNKYSGPELTSFGQNTRSFGLLVGGTKKNSFIGMISGIQLNFLSGQQNLMDGTTKKVISFSGYGASTYFGVTITPLLGASFLEPYLISGGNFGITFLENKTKGLTNIAGSESKGSMGYFFGFGIAQLSGKSLRGKMAPYFEFRFDFDRGTFFEVSGFQKNTASVILGLNY